MIYVPPYIHPERRGSVITPLPSIQSAAKKNWEVEDSLMVC